ASTETLSLHVFRRRCVRQRPSRDAGTDDCLLSSAVTRIPATEHLCGRVDGRDEHHGAGCRACFTSQLVTGCACRSAGRKAQLVTDSLSRSIYKTRRLFISAAALFGLVRVRLRVVLPAARVLDHSVGALESV